MIAYCDYATDGRVRREAETLASQGFDVVCLTNQAGEAPVSFELEGVQVRELPVPRYQGKSTLAYLGSYVRFLLVSSGACLWRRLRGELDVVHVHNLPDFLVLAGLLPRFAGTKVILDVHDTIPETFATKFSGRPFLQKALRVEERLSTLMAHRVICTNSLQQDALVARGTPRGKTFVSMNVPDPKIFGCPRGAGNVDTNGNHSFNLVYHGTMVERLGIDLIIRAVARLRRRVPCVRLHLWGGGDDLEAFCRLAAELGVEDAVLFNPKGYPLQELPARLRSMHVGVVGNRRTAAGELMLPVKLMEYVAMGIPAVVPRLKPIERYFADDTVSYYEPDDVESMSDAIYRLYCAPAARAGQVERAAEFLRAFGWERQGTELVALYRSLLGAGMEN
jgi:glycosyltransferase involved in cell wall biosynthesis